MSAQTFTRYGKIQTRRIEKDTGGELGARAGTVRVHHPIRIRGDFLAAI